MERPGEFALLLSAGVFVTLVAACGGGPPAERPATTRATDPVTTPSSPEPTTAAPSSEAEIFFPQQKPDLDRMDAMGGGELVLDEAGCLRMEGGTEADPYSEVPVWPADYELDTSGDEVRVLDARGRLRARVGEEVAMGGGGATEDLGGVDERTKLELRERCPGTYFIVGEGVHIVRRD